jgi:hypothetical protein
MTHGRFNRQEWKTSSYTPPGGMPNRYRAKSEMTIAVAVDRVRAELKRMDVDGDDLVISTNLQLRLDGLPRSSQREPDDAGAAVYWRDRTGATRCMAIDRYYRVADNLAAIAATLDAMRAIERHGGAEILDRAFTGFTALEGPAKWWEVLQVDQRPLTSAAAPRRIPTAADRQTSSIASRKHSKNSAASAASRPDGHDQEFACSRSTSNT